MRFKALPGCAIVLTPQDQCDHAKGNLVNALSSDVSESSTLKSFNTQASVQELAQKASSILIDLKDRVSSSRIRNSSSSSSHCRMSGRKYARCVLLPYQ